MDLDSFMLTTSEPTVAPSTEPSNTIDINDFMTTTSEPTLNAPETQPSSKTQIEGIGVEHPQVGVDRAEAAAEAAAEAEKNAVHLKKMETDPGYKWEQEHKLDDEGFEMGVFGLFDDLIAPLKGPALKVGGAAVTYGAYKMLTGLSGKEKKNLANIAKVTPGAAQDLMDTLLYMKKNKITVPRSVWRLDSPVKTGNAILDSKISKIRDDFKDLEYTTLDKLQKNISTKDVTSKDVSQKFASEMEVKYTELSELGAAAWAKYSDGVGFQPLTKAIQKDLMKDIDASISGADSTVKNFITRTLFKNKQEGTLLIKNLDEEASRLRSRLKSYPQNPSNAQKKTMTGIQGQLNAKLREISKADLELTSKPLELNDLVEAKKMLHNKLYVSGGSIGTNNALEKKHLKATNAILDSYMEQLSSPETFEALTKARKISQDTFDTFGYGLTGKNQGKNLDTSGKVIKQGETETLNQFEQELLSSDPDKALVKFRKYQNLLGDTESLAEAKKLYVNKIFGLDMKAISNVATPSIGLQLSDEALSVGLKNALGSESKRQLTKEIFGEEGFKELVALQVLDDVIKKHTPSGGTGFIKEAMSGFDTGILLGAGKLIKSIALDPITYPLHRVGSHTTKILHRLANEMKKKNPQEGKIRNFLRQLKEKADTKKAQYTAPDGTPLFDEPGGGRVPKEYASSLEPTSEPGIDFNYKLNEVLDSIPSTQKMTPEQLDGYLRKRGVSPKEIEQAMLISKSTGTQARPISEYKATMDRLGNRNQIGTIDNQELGYADITLGERGVDTETYKETINTISTPLDNAPKVTHFDTVIDKANAKPTNTELEGMQKAMEGMDIDDPDLPWFVNKVKELKLKDKKPSSTLLGWRRTHQDDINGKPTTVLNEFQSDWAQSERAGKGTFESNMIGIEEHNLMKQQLKEVRDRRNTIIKDIKTLKKEDIQKLPNYNELSIEFEDLAKQARILEDRIRKSDLQDSIIADFPMSDKKFHQYQIVGALDEAIQNGTNRIAIPIQRENELSGSAGVTKFYDSLNKSILPEIRKKLEKQGMKIKISKEPYTGIGAERNAKDYYYDKLVEDKSQEWVDANWDELIDYIDTTEVMSSYQHFDGLDTELQSALGHILRNNPPPTGNELHILEIVEMPGKKVNWDVYSILGAVGLGGLAEKLKENEEQ